MNKNVKKKIRLAMADMMRLLERGADVEEDDFGDEDVDLVMDDKELPLNDETDEDLENEMENTREERGRKPKDSNKESLSELHRGSPR